MKIFQNLSKFRFYKDLFYKEEFEGDKLVNQIRVYFLFVLLFLAFAKAGFFKNFVVTKSLGFTIVLIAAALLYSVVLYLLYRKNIYHPIIKFISVTIDITLVTLSVYSYKLEPYHEYAQIYYLGRFAILYIFIIFTILRYNFTLSLYSGVLAGVEYYFLVIRDNYMTDLTFSFVGPDKITYYAKFVRSEAILKVVYLVLAGAVLGLLALKVKNLVVGSIVREQEKNELLVENKIFDAINMENKKYLDNINEGLILVDSNFNIHDQHSKSMSKIFETLSIGGRNFVDFIYPDLLEQAGYRKELEKFLTVLFHNTISDDDMIKAINPIVDQKIDFVDKHGEIREKTISATFHRIYNDNNDVEDIMVIFEDRTKIVEAQKELLESRNKHESEVEAIACILKIDPETLRDFVEQSDKILNQIETMIDKLNDTEVLNKLFREVHSIKGLARTFGFRNIADLSHKLEDILVDIRDHNKIIDGKINEQVRDSVDKILYEFYSIKDLNTKFKKFISTSIECRSNERSDTNKLNTFFNTLREMTSNIASKFDKEIELKIENTLTEIPIIDKLKTSIIHLVTNSIDHGIEDNFERLSKSKPTTGTITLRFCKQDNKYIIEVVDDGEGINLKRIKKKAVERNLVAEDSAETLKKAEIIRFMFKPGFSSKDKASEISGRGVGLDVVQDELKQIDGKIYVLTKKDKGTTFKIEVPVV